MIDIVQLHPNSFKEKHAVTKSLKEWQDDGIQLLGKNVDPELLKRVYNEFINVLNIFLVEKADVDALEVQRIKIEEPANKIKEFEQHFKTLESQQIDMRSTITEQDSRITKL